jgi:hypothetical protein
MASQSAAGTYISGRAAAAAVVARMPAPSVLIMQLIHAAWDRAIRSVQDTGQQAATVVSPGARRRCTVGAAPKPQQSGSRSNQAVEVMSGCPLAF